MTPEDALLLVAATLPVMAAPNSEAELIQELMRRGVSRDIARQLSGFVPSAFGRVLLQPFSPRFHDVYCLVSETSDAHLILPLADEPIYCAALALARKVAADQTWNMELHQAIALSSAEAHAVRSLQQAGKSVEGLQFTPLVILWDIGPRAVKPGFVNPVPDFLPPPRNTGASPESGVPAKPWWKFW